MPLDEKSKYDELEDELFEGALKNLDHFPQLLDEVKRVKAGERIIAVIRTIPAAAGGC